MSNGMEKLHSARVAAVQALYQIEQSGHPSNTVIKEFLEHRINISQDPKADVTVDTKLFQNIVNATDENKNKIDDLIKGSLAEDWSLERLDSVLRAILRAACAEFFMGKTKKAAIIINEYVNVTHQFFSNKEPKFVNGILDRIARSLDLEISSEKPPKIPDISKSYETTGEPNMTSEGGGVIED